MAENLETGIDAYIDEVWDDVLDDIAALVAHPSVANTSPVEPGAPYGRDVRAALDCALGIAARLGYEVSDDEGYVGICDIPGEREEQVATIAHVDGFPLVLAGTATPGPWAAATAGSWAAVSSTTKALRCSVSTRARTCCATASRRATPSGLSWGATKRWA